MAVHLHHTTKPCTQFQTALALFVCLHAHHPTTPPQGMAQSRSMMQQKAAEMAQIRAQLHRAESEFFAVEEAAYDRWAA